MEATHDLPSKKSNPLATGQFQLLPAKPEDAEAFQRCVLRANANSYAQSVVWPQSRAHLTPPEDVMAHRVARLRKGMESEDTLHYKIIDIDYPDRIIGAANWYKPGHFKVSHPPQDAHEMLTCSEGRHKYHAAIRASYKRLYNQRRRATKIHVHAAGGRNASGLGL